MVLTCLPIASLVSKEVTNVQQGTSKIVIDGSNQHIAIKTEKVKVVKTTTSNSSTLEIFEFYLKSDPKVCPCMSQSATLHFENLEQRSEYLNFLENQKEPIRITENSDKMLESVIAQEISKITTYYVNMKKQSMDEIASKTDELLEEMTIRALSTIETHIPQVISGIEESIGNINEKANLLEKLDRTSRLEKIMNFKASTTDFYMNLFKLIAPLQSSLSSELWKYYSKETLNERAKQIFSESDELNKGVKTVILNGMCYENEMKNEHTHYIRYLDTILSLEDKTKLFDQEQNKVIWVYKEYLNLSFFQNLFNELAKEDLNDSNYFNIYSKLYNSILHLRAKPDKEHPIKDEEDALMRLLHFSDSESKSLFLSKDEREEYLLMKTIIYKRLSLLGIKFSLALDKVDSQIVVDNGLPLQFFVRRKADRKLLKQVVRENNLKVNLNILKYNIDQLTTDEEFDQKANGILFNYLDEMFVEGVLNEDIEEILENLDDLLSSISIDTHRGEKLRQYSIRYVYFKYHFNYTLGTETHPKTTNAIVNIERMHKLRPILDIAFRYVSKDSQVLMNTIYKSVENGDNSYEESYLEMQMFFKRHMNLVEERIIKASLNKNVLVLGDICRVVLFDIRSFVKKEDIKSADGIIKICYGIEDFQEIVSFRARYFYSTIKILSLSKIFNGVRQKQVNGEEFVEIYLNVVLFREFGTRTEDALYHLALEFDYFLKSEVMNINFLTDVAPIYEYNSKEFFDVVKISNLHNLMKFPKLLKMTKFYFIFFRKMTYVLKFFDLNEPINYEFMEAIYSEFKEFPRFYHVNNVYLLLNLQKEADDKDIDSLQDRLQANYKRINVFSEDSIQKDHERTIVHASRIAVIYFYTIYLQTCNDVLCQGETRNKQWKNYENFLKGVLINETPRMRIYFFTDYIYDNMNTDQFKDSFENVVYDKESFINNTMTPKLDNVNRRILTSWAYEKLVNLNYTNSPSRYLENIVYDFYKELVRNKNFDKAEEMKVLMVENTLAFHRRNGHMNLSNLVRQLLGALKLNKKIPSQFNMDLVMFNCVAEFVAAMNSPDKKYHEFQPKSVKRHFISFVITYFKNKGELYNEKLRMPKEKKYIRMNQYVLPHIISIFSIFKIDLINVFEIDYLKKYINNAEFLSWSMFAPAEHLTSVTRLDELETERIKNVTAIKKAFKTYELNNLTTQNLEGFFQPLCHFEDAMISANYIDQGTYLQRLESIIPECLSIVRTSGPSDAKRILFKLIKIFYMPEKYYKESIIIFEDDALPDWLIRAKDLFNKIKLIAQDTIDFHDFAQMMQKVLASKAKVVNSHFQKFIKDFIANNNVESIIKMVDQDLTPNGLLDVDQKKYPLVAQKKNTLRNYYFNSVIYDVLTLLPIKEDTFTISKDIWNLDFFHLLNRKSSYASFLTNVFQNYSLDNPADFQRFYLLICKFKLVRLLQNKKKLGKLERKSNISSIANSDLLNDHQEAITREEAPLFDTFIKNSMDLPKDLSNRQTLIDNLYYLKITNLDINIVDMKVFEMSENYATNIVQDIRDLLKVQDKVEGKTLQAILSRDSELTNNLSFYYQESKKMNNLIERYDEINDKFAETDDTDVQENYATYIKNYMDLYDNKFGLKLSEEDTIMYQRNIRTLLFKFDAHVVF